MNKPLIGITCNFLADIPDTVKAGIAAPGQPWELLAEDYVQSVEKAGGVPVLLPVHAHFEPEMLERLDGVLVSGGNDVTPQLYGERFDIKCGKLDVERDTYELALIKKALELNMPLLGICRGVQIFNVALGGTLYQDLPSAGFEPHTLFTGDRGNPTHHVVFPQDSPLCEIIGGTGVWVNSFHHQAVRDLAPGLVVAAHSVPDHVVESVHFPGKKFALAVQWHPEMMPKDPLQQRIFSAFTEACR